MKMEGLVSRAIKSEGYFVFGTVRSSGLSVTDLKFFTRVTKTWKFEIVLKWRKIENCEKLKIIKKNNESLMKKIIA